jgi:hypothetical protein
MHYNFSHVGIQNDYRSTNTSREGMSYFVPFAKAPRAKNVGTMDTQETIHDDHQESTRSSQEVEIKK